MTEISPSLNALRLGTSQAAEITPTQTGRMAWIGVYPIDRSKRWGQEFLRGRNFPADHAEIYRVRAFEIETAKFSEDVWYCETDLNNLCDELVGSAEALEAVLQTYGLRIRDLKMPAQTTYPI